jgi:catechol 2,3-dioxygenase-like lactoylglutathione lyase family enzyme
MLGDKDVCGVIAVKDLDSGKKFYEETLGLKQDKEDPGGILYNSGKSKLYLYQSEFAGTNKATAVAWNVDDIDGVVSALKAKGVSFEHYDNLPGVKLEGDVHVMGSAKAAWFKDPDGNILNVVSGM